MKNNDPNNNKIFFCLDFAKFAFIFNKHNTVSWSLISLLVQSKQLFRSGSGQRPSSARFTDVLNHKPDFTKDFEVISILQLLQNFIQDPLETQTISRMFSVSLKVGKMLAISPNVPKTWFSTKVKVFMIIFMAITIILGLYFWFSSRRHLADHQEKVVQGLPPVSCFWNRCHVHSPVCRCKGLGDDWYCQKWKYCVGFLGRMDYCCNSKHTPPSDWNCYQTRKNTKTPKFIHSRTRTHHQLSLNIRVSFIDTRNKR